MKRFLAIPLSDYLNFGVSVILIARFQIKLIEAKYNYITI